MDQTRTVQSPCWTGAVFLIELNVQTDVTRRRNGEVPRRSVEALSRGCGARPSTSVRQRLGGLMTIDNYLRQPRCARFPFLFVITFGRSGSTLLQGILNSIPGYCIRGENNSTLFQLFNASCMHAEAHWDHGRKKTDTAHAWFGADLLDPKHFRRTLTDTFLQTCLRQALIRGARASRRSGIRPTSSTIPSSQAICNSYKPSFLALRWFSMFAALTMWCGVLGGRISRLKPCESF